MALPIFVIFILFYLIKMPNYRREKGNIKSLLETILAAGVVTLFSSGYVLAFNVLVGKQEKELIEGRVVNLSTTSSTKGGTNYAVLVRVNGFTKSVKLSIPKSEYFKLEKGDVYYGEWTRGSLGMLYR